jgi:23S rRNA pseudouridine2605 synthase
VATKKRVGLERVLSKMGFCSRSQARALIHEGRVTVNGRRVLDPEAPVREGRDQLAVDRTPVNERGKVYLAMNKPRGIVTTASDEKGRQTVYDLLSPEQGWVGPVGRLDKASEGLLLLTNDSEWAARITDPASHLDKTYHVQVDCVADSDLLQRIRRGVVAEGDLLRAKSARVLRQGQKNTWLEIRLDEGKHRQIRRMLTGLGVEVLRLVRVSVGPLALGDLKRGAVRPLTPSEKRALDQAMDHGPTMVR